MNNNLKQILITAAVAGIVSALVVLIIGGLVGNQSASLGSGTRFPHGISADNTSPSAEQIRGTTLLITGDTVLMGETRTPLVETGTKATLTINATTTTLTAAQVCDNNVIEWAPGVTASATLPSAALVYADCLTTDGDQISFLFRDTSATSTQTISIVAGASTTLIGATTTDDEIAITSSNLVRLIRASVTEMIAIVATLVDAD